MLISMTGYGKAENKRNNINYFIEVRSVNGRYNEVNLRCPKYLYSREYEIKEILKPKVSRGKINILITKDDSDNMNTEMKLDDDALKIQIDILKKIRKKINSKEKIKIEHLISFSDYFLIGDENSVDEEEFNFIKQLLNDAVDEMVEMKKREGKFLEKDILERINKIEEVSENIKNLSNSRVEEERKFFDEKVNNFLSDRTLIEEKRLEYEIAMLTEKMDITEECVRLKSHLDFFSESVNSNENVGRRLNFLLQEMNREINTMASKAMDALISQKVSLLKEDLEKIREQIQNVE